MKFNKLEKKALKGAIEKPRKKWLTSKSFLKWEELTTSEITRESNLETYAIFSQTTIKFPFPKTI